MSNKDIIVSVV